MPSARPAVTGGLLGWALASARLARGAGGRPDPGHEPSDAGSSPQAPLVPDAGVADASIGVLRASGIVVDESDAVDIASRRLRPSASSATRT